MAEVPARSALNLSVQRSIAPASHRLSEHPHSPWVGTVIATQANYYRVQLDQPVCSTTFDLPPQREWLCICRSRLKKIGQRVMVGDRVRLEEPDWQGQRAAIAEVFERHSAMDRPPVANVNQILLIFALGEPDLDPHLLTRFLVKVESLRLSLCLGLSKSDLVSADLRRHWSDRLSTWGYQPILFSVPSGEGLESLLSQLRNRITVICGPSGVGKSSLINTLIPALELRVGRVSGKLGKGRHTTRHVELFPIAPGALVADTPGFNRPTLPSDPAALADLFPELRQPPGAAACRFSNCLHQGDPGCVIAPGWDREALYRQCLADLLDEAAREERRPDRGPGLRQRGNRLEPRLDPRLRHPSRRRQRQQPIGQDGTLGEISPPDPAG